MKDDSIESYLSVSGEQQYRMTLDPQFAPALRAYFGDAAYADLAALAERGLRRLEVGSLGITAPPNLIFVPGIMGSMLRSKTLGGVWWIDALRGYDKLNRIGLALDGASDADSSYQIEPFAIDTLYAPFLQAALLRDDFGHLVFPYDWRKSVTHSIAALRDLINHTAATNGGEPIHLVGHSMGGLVIRATLQAYGDDLWSKVGRIAFLGTPHYGSPLAVRNVKFHLWAADRQSLFLAVLVSPETLRSLWGAVGLIPAPRGVYPGTQPDSGQPWSGAAVGGAYIHPCVNFDLYDASAWQLGISVEQETNLQRILDHTRQQYELMQRHHQTLDDNLRGRMAVIAGVGQSTLSRLAYEPGLFGMRMARVGGRIDGDPHRDGDGTVPLASAKLEDIGAIRFVAGAHAALPNLKAVYEDVFRWLNEEPLKLPKTAEAALLGELGDEDDTINAYPDLTRPAEAHALGSTADTAVTAPTPEERAEIEARIRAGDIPPEINLTRLF